ncbi:alpha-(1,3)-fucosyltransferase C-like [Pectinophora gossypiella]|uniref:alpha-(1,3)-fucosyltransferase C-like n=1 Tax=Pectinophora gossypiella TaxID=13191 RepID=UPI00214E11FC|nr:alpha-(1,3)-fucosyltransferase C-like [Pectinophora gossypiella]
MPQLWKAKPYKKLNSIKKIKIPRLANNLKYLTHLFYLSLFSFYLMKHSHKTVTIRQLDRFVQDLKHILIWTKLPGIEKEGQVELIDRRCDYWNCYFTKNRTLLEDMKYFDAIIFNAQEVSKGMKDLPKERGRTQKFIFAANDSADNYPVCDPVYDNFFNWTWTYRIDSIIPYGFISVYNLDGIELGNNFQFKHNMKSLNLAQMHHMTVNARQKAAAIFLEKCKSRSRREKFIEELQKALTKYNLTVDVYGQCGPYKCKRKSMKSCNFRLKKTYFFYLALEDSIAEDFITDVVLPAYKNDIVPIVYGGAKYDRFLPYNSYIDARKHNISTLAKMMNGIMEDGTRYYEFFRWKNHYTVESANILDPCSLCEQLNRPLLKPQAPVKIPLGRHSAQIAQSKDKY